MLARIAPYRLRLLFRGAFLALGLATIALALYVLWAEKELSYRSYAGGVGKTMGEIAARLRHPAGQLALLNPPQGPLLPLHPYLLPFASIDFDDRDKVRQAIEMAGCQVRYRDGSLCVAIGNDPWAGGFIYVAGDFTGPDLVPHARGDRHADHASRLWVSVSLRGQTYEWIAPFEAMGRPGTAAIYGHYGRLTGFVEHGLPVVSGRPVKDFRGWIWQHPYCAEGRGEACRKQGFFSARLPVEVLHQALLLPGEPQWPPPDLGQIQVHVRLLPPGDGVALLDSDSASATPPFSLDDLAPLLLPGETLRIDRLSHEGGISPLLTLAGRDAGQGGGSWPWLTSLVRRLPVTDWTGPARRQALIATPSGNYRLTLGADFRSVNAGLAQVAARVVWFVGGILLALFITWCVIEISIIRRIVTLTRRADSVSRSVRGSGVVDGLDLTDLRGADELGVLASCLADLLQRVREDVRREQIRAAQEKDLWHAVGHEIMSPLQSLLALHGKEEDASTRYIRRMQQAVRVLYGSASPSEAFEATTLQVSALDIGQFLGHVATNAPCVGIADVVYVAGPEVILARADEYPLEDVMTHVLRNADRHRPPGTPITISLAASATLVTVTIHNQGSPIATEPVERIFEYGVSDQPGAGAGGSRGQGLFVARTYMAKMGGTIVARNEADGVSFVLSLQRA